MSQPIVESRVQPETQLRSRHLVVAGLLAALMASSAWIALPIGAVPITLQLFVVVLAALLLPPRWAAASMGVYLALGALGAPVFAGGRGGLGVLVGPTGGYLFGFLAGATLGAVVRCLLVRLDARDVVADSAGALTVVVVVYLLGWAQLALVTDSSLAEAFAVGVVPFIAFDVVKAAIAVGVASALRRVGVVAA